MLTTGHLLQHATCTLQPPHTWDEKLDELGVTRCPVADRAAGGGVVVRGGRPQQEPRERRRGDGQDGVRGRPQVLALCTRHVQERQQVHAAHHWNAEDNIVNQVRVQHRNNADKFETIFNKVRDLIVRIGNKRLLGTSKD